MSEPVAVSIDLGKSKQDFKEMQHLQYWVGKCLLRLKREAELPR